MKYKKLTIAIFLIGISLLSAEKASACVCGGEPRILSAEEIRAAIAREFDASASVFSGEVIEIDVFTVKFRVTRIWKGEIAEEIVMSTGTVRVDENLARSSSCDYRFSLGERYLVYARNFEAGLVAYKCTRTELSERAEGDIAELNNMNPNASQFQSPDIQRLLLTKTKSSTPQTSRRRYSVNSIGAMNAFRLNSFASSFFS